MVGHTYNPRTLEAEGCKAHIHRVRSCLKKAKFE